MRVLPLGKVQALVQLFKIGASSGGNFSQELTTLSRKKDRSDGFLERTSLRDPQLFTKQLQIPPIKEILHDPFGTLWRWQEMNTVAACSESNNSLALAQALRPSLSASQRARNLTCHATIIDAKYLIESAPTDGRMRRGRSCRNISIV